MVCLYNLSIFLDDNLNYDAISLKKVIWNENKKYIFREKVTHIETYWIWITCVISLLRLYPRYLKYIRDSFKCVLIFKETISELLEITETTKRECAIKGDDTELNYSGS